MTKSNYRTTSDLIEKGNIDDLKAYFLEDISRLHEDSSYFGTAIHLAAMEASVAATQCLLELGADPNCLSESENTPLSFAVKSGSLETVQCLLNHGAIVNLESPTENPYILSILRGHRNLVEYFLEANVDPHVVVTREDGSKRNALSFAIEREETEIVELLKQHGCTLPPDFEFDDLHDASEKEGALIQHIEGRFGTANALSLQSVIPTPGNINIHYIRSSSEHPFSTVYTNGMSEARMEPEDNAEGYEYAELVWHLPES